FFAGAIVVFDKTWTGKKFDYIHRDELEQIGKAFIEQMKWLASRGVA
ncbi:TPA: DNA adenine methylase, partial [Proteus mirabilis]|nr:DNA adenine methylase [Proteus mirabilis]